MKNDEQNIRVTSYFQKGGVTANNVFFEKPQRKLSNQIGQELISKLSKDKMKRIDIICVMGDTEAFIFGNEIADYLRLNGYNYITIGQGTFPKPVLGQRIIQKDQQPIRIIIGSNP